MEKQTLIKLENKKLHGHIYAVCSGSKAAGKTWLTTTICHNLGILKKKVLFFDADCGVENIAGQLGIKQCTAYSRLLNGNQTINNSVFRFDKGKFDLICCFPGEDRFNNAPAGRTQLLAGDLAYFSKHYDFVFVDCATDNNKTINPFFNICSNIVLLVNSDPAAVTAAYHKLETLKKISADTQFYIVINQAVSVEEGMQTYKTLLKAAQEYIKVNLNLLGVIRQDSRIREAVVNRSLLLSRYPACEGTEDVKKIVRQILEENKNGI